jgi:hypothetical protein
MTTRILGEGDAGRLTDGADLADGMELASETITTRGRARASRRSKPASAAEVAGARGDEARGMSGQGAGEETDNFRGAGLGGRSGGNVYKIDDLNFQKRNADSDELIVGLAVDYYICDENQIILSGWMVGRRATLDFVRQTSTIALFRRPDVENSFTGLAEEIHGFVAVARLDEDRNFSFFGLVVAAPESNAPALAS